MAHRHTGRHYPTSRADRHYDPHHYTTSRADRGYGRSAAPDHEPYNPEQPQFVPSDSSRGYYAHILAESFMLVDKKPSPGNVGIFQGIFALVDGACPGLVSKEHRARHEFLASMRGVQCLLDRMAAESVSVT